jgi:hypothetical protein
MNMSLLFCRVPKTSLVLKTFILRVRMPIILRAFLLVYLSGIFFCTFPVWAQKKEPMTNKQQTIEQDGHEFDGGIGVWKTSLKRLLKPLSGSTEWAEYQGTTTVTRIWDGKASLAELVADGPAGRIEALALRLYNPASRQWSLNFASARGGAISIPAIGEFKRGRGEFYCQETYNERAILLKFVITIETPDSWTFEQSFSTDGGKTWELNWIAHDTRAK